MSLLAALSKPGRGETRSAPAEDRGLSVLHQIAAHALEQDIVSRLARFFPEATPVRIPIKLSRANGHDDDNHANPNRHGDASAREGVPEKRGVFIQDTVIEFGTPHEILFAVNRPLEFADRVLVESKDGALHAEGSVVAVQYHPETTVVAVRFLKQVPNWIVKS